MEEANINQKGIIIGVNTYDDEKLFLEEISELKNLAFACEIDIIDTVYQNRREIEPNSYLGKGKIDEVKMVIDALDIEVVVCNDELLPNQISFLEKALDIQVFDRTYIILEIFNRRAKTKEAYLQVEIARLDYLLPRLVGMHQGLSRQRGTGGGFAKGKGRGETQLELDRRRLTSKIVSLRKELADLTLLRQEQRRARSKNEEKIVSLVGYTNSGKSSTLNAIMASPIVIKKDDKKKVLEKDMLFATLETSTRAIQLKSGSKFLLTDTVGFVNKLPTGLVESFKSTLEEVSESDLIIHVVDASNPNYEAQIKATNDTLAELNASNIPVIYAFNKTDLIDNYFFIPQNYYPSITISAKDGINIDRLIEMVLEKLFSDYIDINLSIPYVDTKIVEEIKKNAIKYDINYNEENISFIGKINPRIYNYVKKYQKD